ncbi:MAG: hypothetical protein BRD46_05325, partial [Bacteroidetes bacterium QS_8_68_15]
MKGLAHAGAPASAGAGRRPARSRLVPLLFLAAAAVPLGVAAGCTASSDSAADRAAAADTLMLDALADTLSPAEAARYAFHGRDREGKDGPLANIGYDLAHLYFAYCAHRRAAAAEGDTSFQPPSDGMTVTEAGKVTVNATAAESGEQLRADLDALGLDGGATAG